MPRILIATLLLLAGTSITPAVQAGVLGEGMGGALQGAFLGRMIGGRKSAGTGAIIGGLIGAGESAARQNQHRQQEMDRQQRQAAWAAAQQADQQRIQQQTSMALASADQTLVVETQKSLIRLGFDPGPLGTDGPALTRAVIDYQRSHGLLDTGELSQPLLTHMLRNGG